MLLISRYGASHSQALGFARKGAVTGAITGGVGHGLDNTSAMNDYQKILVESGASGVNSEISGGSFEDGFKVALVTSSAKYLYRNVSSNYNKSGKVHLWQEGNSDVGKTLPDDYWDKNVFPKHFDANGNKIIPWSSDQSNFMKGFGKNVPYGDSFAEFHDGFHDLPFVPTNQLALVVTMPHSYAFTFLADTQNSNAQINIYRDIKRSGY